MKIKNQLFDTYPLDTQFLDEVFDKNKKPKSSYEKLLKHYQSYTLDDFKILNNFARNSFLTQGITFATYNENPRGNERIFPFDLFPRVIGSLEWQLLERGLIQRNLAINEFIHDLYNKKSILHDNIVPLDLIMSSKNLLGVMENFTPPGKIYNHICGTDLIKHKDGKYYVLEDNVRCPSGVSYVLANREAMKKSLSALFKSLSIRTVVDYPEHLLDTLQSVSPNNVDDPVCVVLTPGVYNSAYYEHSFLAQNMGVELVEGRDLFVDNDFLYMHTVYGPQKVDVVYRRVDDDFLDPVVFNPDSVLGVPGLMGAYRKGNVSIINAPGAGVADDKAVYAYMPEIIKYYMDEDPILQNVPTYRCSVRKEREYVLQNIHNLVVKPVDESGGYGIFMGQLATETEIEEQKKIIKKTPRKYIAQPIMSLSLHSTFIESEEKFEPRHVDLRTFTLLGKNKQYVLQGGLSRVALKKGSLIVNSSQGGGSKDTWVLED